MEQETWSHPSSSCLQVKTRQIYSTLGAFQDDEGRPRRSERIDSSLEVHKDFPCQTGVLKRPLRYLCQCESGGLILESVAQARKSAPFQE